MCKESTLYTYSAICANAMQRVILEARDIMIELAQKQHEVEKSNIPDARRKQTILRTLTGNELLCG